MLVFSFGAGRASLAGNFGNFNMHDWPARALCQSNELCSYEGMIKLELWTYSTRINIHRVEFSMEPWRCICPSLCHTLFYTMRRHVSGGGLTVP